MNPELRRRMTTPVLVTAGLIAGLALNMLLASAFAFPGRGYVEAAVSAAMVATVLFVSMEVRREAPLVRLFAVAGFLWLLILFGMTTLDYATR